MDTPKTTVVTVRLNENDITVLDKCAKFLGISRSAYIRQLVLRHMGEELSEIGIDHTAEVLQKVLENILDVNNKKTLKTLSALSGEIERANFMQLKNYIELHPGLDESDYRSFYFQSDKEAFEVSSGRKPFSSILPSQEVPPQTKQKPKPAADIPEWLKILSGENKDE